MYRLIFVIKFFETKVEWSDTDTIFFLVGSFTGVAHYFDALF